MNSTVFVINADNGKCIIKLNTAYRPVNKVYFTADSKQLVLILCNNTEYIYDLCVNSASCRKQIPDKLDFDANDYFGVYQVYEEDDSPKFCVCLKSILITVIYQKALFITDFITAKKTLFCLKTDCFSFVKMD